MESNGIVAVNIIPNMFCFVEGIVAETNLVRNAGQVASTGTGMQTKYLHPLWEMLYYGFLSLTSE